MACKIASLDLFEESPCKCNMSLGPLLKLANWSVLYFKDLKPRYHWTIKRTYIFMTLLSLWKVYWLFLHDFFLFSLVTTWRVTSAKKHVFCFSTQNLFEHEYRGLLTWHTWKLYNNSVCSLLPKWLSLLCPGYWLWQECILKSINCNPSTKTS